MEPGAETCKLLHTAAPILTDQALESPETQFSAATLPCNQLKADMQPMFDNVEQYY